MKPYIHQLVTIIVTIVTNALLSLILELIKNLDLGKFVITLAKKIECSNIYTNIETDQNGKGVEKVHGLN